MTQLITLVLCLPLVWAKPIPPHNSEYIDLSQLYQIDVRIVTVTAQGSATTRKTVASSSASELKLGSFSVENSDDQFYFPLGEHPNTIGLEVGKRYLCLGYRATSDYVTWPVYDRAVLGSSDRTVGPFKEGDVLVLDVFETLASTLPDLKDVNEKTCTAILESATSGKDNALEVTKFFTRNLYPGHSRKILNPIAPFSLSTVCGELAKGAAAYTRVKLLEIPVRWKVYGSETAYMEALLSTVSNFPATFTKEDDFEFVLNFMAAEFVKPPGYRLPLADGTQWLDAILKSPTHAILNFLLTRVPRGPLTDAQYQKLATLLNDEDEVVVRELCNFFAVRLSRQDLVVRGRYVEQNGRKVWKHDNLATVQAFWKKKFGID